MDWTIKEQGYCKENIEFYGSKFCIGNGYFGYRGTLEEYGKEQLAACTVSEIFDDNGSGWREPVNVPNVLRTCIRYKGKSVSVLESGIISHEQALEIDKGLHKRNTTFLTGDGSKITVKAERFAYLEDVHLMVMRYSVSANEAMEIELVTEIDCEVWDINGPHFARGEWKKEEGVTGTVCETKQDHRQIAAAQKVVMLSGNALTEEQEGTVRICGKLNGDGEKLEFVKYAAICKDTDCEDVWKSAVEVCTKAERAGFVRLLEIQKKCWSERYKSVGIKIKGDEEAEQAIYYSCYLLMSSAPFHTDQVAVPARGLSGQVYKGAMFWDTEIYMLPLFLFCQPETARNLVNYRVKNLQGALKKAREYGYQGAFFPWESQENGEDGCTHYNLTDIFTGRKIRTYFRDKQIHISADVVYGLWKYISITKDTDLLFEGGAETILECARFFYSYSYYKKEKCRFEFLDVTGADEYHERINNDAYTNYIIHFALKAALHVIRYLKRTDLEYYEKLLKKIHFEDAEKIIGEMEREIYLPQPDEDGVIEQFDGYFKEEDLSVEELYSRRIKPNEYLGSPVGLAVNTQIIKQADVVLLLSLLSEQFSREIKEKNWMYYEPRTEHGSSLSTCIYALLAAQIGKADWAYQYLMRAARIDLDGDYKLYLGSLYIGGTHPAANGGTWMVTVQGFGGLTVKEDCVRITPCLPEKWKELEYRFFYRGDSYHVTVRRGQFTVASLQSNQEKLTIETESGTYDCAPGKTVSIREGV